MPIIDMKDMPPIWISNPKTPNLTIEVYFYGKSGYRSDSISIEEIRGYARNKVKEEEKITNDYMLKKEPNNPNLEIVSNSIGMKLVYIPPGEFLMGSSDNELGRMSEEGPQHKVVISKGFWLGVYEVTQRQWQAVMGNNPSHFKGDDLPVEMVSWNDAVEFCQRLSQKEGKNYHLPTKAQWEYACRAGTTTRYCFGDSEKQLGEYAWYYDNSKSRTHPVGTKKPNAWGLYDMHGNIWEWCSDWYGDYSSDTQINPIGPPNGTARVLRGGSWAANSPQYCRSAFRFYYTPGRHLVGFRMALDIK